MSLSLSLWSRRSGSKKEAVGNFQKAERSANFTVITFSSVMNRLGTGTLEGVLFARVGVRDNVGPQCITERSTHLLGNAREQPALALLCSLCAPSWTV